MFSIRRALFALATFCLHSTQLVVAKSSTGNSVLVVLEKALDKNDYSVFFGQLEERGYKLTFREPNAVKPVLVEYDVPQFEHVIIFAPTTKSYTPDLQPQNLLPLLQQKVNLLLALSPSQTPLSSFAPEFGLIVPPPNTPLISHFPPRDSPVTTLEIPLPSNGAHPLFSSATSSEPILFSGVNFGITSNPQLFSILNATAESFATDTSKDSEADILVEATDRGGEGLWAGSSMSVVAGFQGKNGGRVAWVGGVKVFSDEYINGKVTTGKKSGNEEFVRDVSAWAFQENAVLRVEGIEHHRVGETEPREHYTINDQVTYTINISKYNPSTSTWVPYSDIDDLQLEFTMLDPHIRTSLTAVKGKPGAYQTTFRVPDRHGVFKFIVDYRRKGWSTLYSATTIPVVPPRHDEYPRFLSAAWPYYAGAISSSIGFLAFCALWLGGAGELKGKTE